MTKSKFPDHISDRVFDLCNSFETVSSLLAKDPSLSPHDAWNKLFGRHALKKRHLGGNSSEEEEEEEEEENEEEYRYSISGSEEKEHLNNPGGHQGSTASAYYYNSPPTPPHSPTSAHEHLDRAAKCGKWGGKRPSGLFLQVLWLLRFW